MSVTIKKQRGENLWIISRDGQPIGQVNFHEPGAGGVDRSRQYRPYVYVELRGNGDHVVKGLPYESSPREAAAAIAGFDQDRFREKSLYKGRRFTHARILDEHDRSKGQECVVTRIVRGWVYYKTIHGADANGRLVLAGGGCFPVQQWGHWAAS